MKNEAEFKSVFKKSVKAQGGFALSLAAPMIAGIPDLYVIMPGYCPLLLEAKFIKEVKNHRKIDYSKLQLHWLNEINKIKDYTALGLVGFKADGVIVCSLSHPKFEHINRIGFNVQLNHKKLFDIELLFSYYPIPRLNGVPTPVRT